MTITELSAILKAHKENFAEESQKSKTLLGWFWSIFEELFKDATSIPYEFILVFDNYCPNFSQDIRCLTMTKILELQNRYAEARKPFYSKIRQIEDAHPKVLYIRTSNKVKNQTKCEFLPFGVFEKKKDHSFFVTALISPVQSGEEAFERFKAYVFTNLSYTHTTSCGQKYNCVDSKAINSLRRNFPEFMKRFSKEQSEALKSLGYFEALSKFSELKRTEKRELRALSPAEASSLLTVRINNRNIPIVYSNTSDT